MLMILGFIMIFAAFYQGFMLRKMNKRPKAKAEILSIEMKTGVTAFKKKAYPFAKIKYLFKSELKDVVIALRTKNTVGDQFEVTYDPNRYKDVDQYVPKKDIIPFLIVVGIGIFLVIGSFILIQVLE
jgi:hypothetical protein